MYKMKKVSVIIGTRPEAIKMAPVLHSLQNFSSDFEVNLCTTGQHTTMLDGALAAFDLTPNVQLNVMRPGQSLAELSSRLLLEIDRYFQEFKPDLVLVHGDTTSAMAAAMAAFYRKIPIGHIEAGLRTGNLYSPFPEEYNRRSIAKIATYHFAPTQRAYSNLLYEGVLRENIFLTGNTVIDALILTLERLEKKPEEKVSIDTSLSELLGFPWQTQPFVLITAHRRENFGINVENICLSIKKLAENNPSLYFVYPVHLNPNIKNIVEERLSALSNVYLIPPQDYKSFASLLKNCFFVLTDSGGIQEEAPALKKPVLVMRDTSERPEAIEAGTARLVSTDINTIVAEAQKLISDKLYFSRMLKSENPFGDGKAAEKIVKHLRGI